MNDFLRHEGTPHEGTTPHSGRYPYGSGKTPYQRAVEFKDLYEKYKLEGLSEKQIAERFGIVHPYGNKKGQGDVSRLNARRNVEKNAIKVHTMMEARRLAEEEGLGPSEIGRQLGIGESTIRNYLKEGYEMKMDSTRQTAEVLKNFVDERKYIDIGRGTEVLLGVTDNKLNEAAKYLEAQGYRIHKIKIDQLGTEHKTTYTVLTQPDVDYSELYEHRFDIALPSEQSRVLRPDGTTESIGGITRPPAVSSDRVMIRYNEQGGLAKDGLIEIRRGLDDISLGGAMYAQVRINVDDTHYIKGMAVYRDDLPPGVDVVFNTNKHVGTPMCGTDDKNTVLKPLKRDKETGDVDWSNPFGATITQKKWTDADGNEHVSAVGIVRQEGEWLTKWSNNLASQFLSKQSLAMAKQQLNIAYLDSKKEFEEIKALTNPVVKRKLLNDYWDSADNAAVELKGAPFPHQHWHVLLPEPKLKDNECYAPNYPDGTQLALIRYPHAGKFEIPILTVRNTGSPAEAFMKGAFDAIAVNKTNLDRLSGADTDGDAVVAIPLSDKVRVRSEPALEGLKNYDPKEQYPGYEGMPKISERTKQQQMGIVSNLITDMTMGWANSDELARATRHSMTIIDAKKHNLDWRRSYKENRIDELKEIYQKGGGASTIISRASAPYVIPERKDWKPGEDTIGPNGEKIYKPSGKTYQTAKIKPSAVIDGVKVYLSKRKGEYFYNGSKVPDDKVNPGGDVYINTDKDGRKYYIGKSSSTDKKVRIYVTEADTKTGFKTNLKTEEVPRMSAYRDAYELTSGGSRSNYGYAMERVYAEYANHQKALANAARKEWLATGTFKKDPVAEKQYAAEVKSLNEKLQKALVNSTLERQAQLYGNRVVAIKKKSNPDMDEEEYKKVKNRAIAVGRDAYGSKKKDTLIHIDDNEWKAIQAHAISNDRLTKILENCNKDRLRELATPRAKKTMSATTKALIKSMYNGGSSVGDIEDHLGISATAIYNIIKGEGSES